MKKTLLTVATLTVLVAPVSSMAAKDSFYIKGNIGIGMGMDADIDNMPNGGGTAKMTYDSGFVGSLAAGYDFVSPMRMELEIIKQKNDLDITYYNNYYGSFNEGDLKTLSFMVNGFYDVDTGSAWTPFVGGGIGWSKLDINDAGFNDSDSDDVFTYQFIGGVAYAFNDQWSVDAQYRFIGTSEASIDGADFNVNSNDLMLGLRYSF
ncbi:opacity protein [Desulfocapsa sulfexigens DSM 10523]|uniref:Opacity protein n=1 Tax=Desulfocapsa sulfexigens (strain DSM 10523 / SB164P1) TaxID=1167006 RepID=M1P1F9_DESSD|nr:outer membrane beta-barrel protein [Desulfocapsa sulfexigens]AGF77348.1 opacity protein [Desulfocapsa sulfexigens DSM 10523]